MKQGVYWALSLIVVAGLSGVVIFGGRQYLQSKAIALAPSPTASSSTKAVAPPIANALPMQPRATSTPSQPVAVKIDVDSGQNVFPVPGISEAELKAALTAAKSVEDTFADSRKEMDELFGKLSEDNKAKANQEVGQILATQQAMDASSMIKIGEQPPGNRITIDSVNMTEPGFVIIRKISNDAIVGVSEFLPAGVYTRYSIMLSESIDRESLQAVLFRDDGDQVFNKTKDHNRILDDKGWNNSKDFYVKSVVTSDYVYYSNGIASDSTPAFLLREQPAGKKITFEQAQTFTLDRPDASYSLAIFKDHEGLPGRMIGHTVPERKAGVRSEVFLDESVSNEMLYGMAFEDNGDGVLNFDTDRILRSKSGLIVIIKFKVQ